MVCNTAYCNNEVLPNLTLLQYMISMRISFATICGEMEQEYYQF